MAELPEQHERGKVQVSDPKEVEDIVVEGLQASTAHPPLFAASKHEEEMPEPLSRMTSALSTDHILGDDLGHRRRGFRAWLHDKKTSIKTNFFGIMQRLHAPASVAIAMREASPEERKELVALIDDALEHANETDASTLAGLYTVTASNHNTEGFQVIHKKMCRVVERLHVSKVAEMRDLIDLHSEGRGFLPLVLSGGMEHYRILASKFSSTVTEGYTKPRRCMKIFSDIDDTVIANWVDLLGQSRYGWKAKAVYPGVRELHHQIIKHAANPSEGTVDLIFLSSRPLKHQLNTIDALKRSRFGVPNPGSFTVLYGEFLTNLAPSTMGRFKYSMFKLYSGLYPHMDYVFFGDSGQGDFYCGELMIKDRNPGSSRLRGVFIHEIRRDGEIFRQVQPSTPTEHLHYCYHYGQAARAALEEGIITKEGYDKVIETFVRESKAAAKEGEGDAKMILATFTETPAAATPAQIAKPPDVNQNRANTAH